MIGIRAERSRESRISEGRCSINATSLCCVRSLFHSSTYFKRVIHNFFVIYTSYRFSVSLLPQILESFISVKRGCRGGFDKKMGQQYQ